MMIRYNKNFFRIAIVFLIPLFFIGCASSDGGGDSSSTDTTTTTTTIPISDLRKEVSSSTVTSSDGYISIGAFYATRSYTSSQYVNLSIPVTNNYSSVMCFLRLNLTFKDSSGNTLLDTGGSFIDGTVYQLSSSIETNTCLTSGQTSYVFTIDINDASTLWDDLSSVSIDSYSASTSSSYTTLTSNLEEQSGGSYTASSVSVTAKNTGTVTLYPNSYTSTILLDSDGIPLMWGFATNSTSSVASGSTVNYTDYPYYEGSTVNSGKLYLDYGTYSSSSSALTRSFQSNKTGIQSDEDVLEVKRAHQQSEFDKLDGIINPSSQSSLSESTQGEYISGSF